MKLNFLNRKFPLALLLISTAVSVGYYIYYNYGNRLSFTAFPSSDIRVEPVSDTWEGGNSWINAAQNDSSIVFSYHLKSGFRYPYAGIKIFLADSFSSGVDLSVYDSMSISIRASNSDAVRLFLKSFDPGITDVSRPNTYWYHEKEFVPDSSGLSIKFGLDEFAIPTWWKLEHAVSEQKRPEKLSSVNHIELLNGLSTSNSDTVTVTISSITFSGKNRFLEKAILIPVVLLWLLTFIGFINYCLLRWLKGSTLKAFKSNALSAYKKLNLKSDEEQQRNRLVAYMTEHYFDADLTIEVLALKTGISRKTASCIIKKYLETNFKGYLNHLRLNEAARILRDTDKQITEIALSVGYNNINHFSRIFKEKFGMPPKEYRQSRG